MPFGDLSALARTVQCAQSAHQGKLNTKTTRITMARSVILSTTSLLLLVSGPVWAACPTSLSTDLMVSCLNNQLRVTQAELANAQGELDTALTLIIDNQLELGDLDSRLTVAEGDVDTVADRTNLAVPAFSAGSSYTTDSTVSSVTIAKTLDSGESDIYCQFTGLAGSSSGWAYFKIQQDTDTSSIVSSANYSAEYSQGYDLISSIEQFTGLDAGDHTFNANQSGGGMFNSTLYCVEVLN